MRITRRGLGLAALPCLIISAIVTGRAAEADSWGLAVFGALSVMLHGGLIIAVLPRDPKP